MLVYTKDQPDLFARICGYFDQAGFSILDAKIHTTTNGYALDTFQVVTAMLPEHYRELVSMVETDLEQTLQRAGPLPAPSRGRVSPASIHAGNQRHAARASPPGGPGGGRDVLFGHRRLII